jgi:hypothetical protein
VIIGKRDANAINPKPSIKGERPGTLEASPIPNAAINRTVTVEVVTPPESYARGMICLGAKQVWISKKTYPATI